MDCSHQRLASVRRSDAEHQEGDLTARGRLCEDRTVLVRHQRDQRGYLRKEIAHYEEMLLRGIHTLVPAGYVVREEEPVVNARSVSNTKRTTFRTP